MKYERINPKTNVTNFLPRFFRKTINNIKYDNVNFFDTNMIVKKSGEKEDDRIKSICKINKVVTSEVFNEEATNLLKTGRYHKIYNGFYAILNFEKMRFKNPELCPLYYNYIHCMVNPANISSLLFWKERVLSIKIRNPNLSEEELASEMNINKIVSSKIDAGRRDKIDIFGENKGLASDFVDTSVQKYYQKKVEALSKNHAGYYNDLRSLAIAILYCIKEHSNIHFFTSDSDMVIHFRNWIDSVNHQKAIKYLILQKLLQENNGRERIWGGKEKLIFKIPLNDYLKLEYGFRTDMLALDWKKSSYYFQIHSWDEGRQKYIDDVKVNFNELMEESLLNLHGPLSCPFVKNNNYANWYCWSYVWPPRINEDIDKIELTIVPKIHRNFKTIFDSAENHRKFCSYANADIEENLKVLSGFEWAKHNNKL